MLAAGSSSRLGRAKQLVRHRSRPLVLHSVDLAARISPNRVVVVIGCEALRLRRLLRARCPAARIVFNRHWRTGMGSSLAAGIRSLPHQARAVLILLCDQPDIAAASLSGLVAAGRRVAATSYDGRPGVPAVFPRRYFRCLGALAGDAGARGLLAGIGNLRLVEIPGAQFDVDTPADVANLR